MNENLIIIGPFNGKYMCIKKLILVSGFNNYLSPDKNDIHNKLNLSYYVNDYEISKMKDYV